MVSVRIDRFTHGTGSLPLYGASELVGLSICYPSLSSRGRGRQKLVKYERFCLLMALTGSSRRNPQLFYALSLYEPAYGLLLILALSLLVKLGFKRRVYLSDRAGFKRIYMLVFVLVAVYLLIASAQ